MATSSNYSQIVTPPETTLSTVDARQADKFGFAPADGEFKSVRTFGQIAKHFSARSHILAAAALGEEPPADAGDELGSENVRSKADILTYLKVHSSTQLAPYGIRCRFE